MSVQVLSPFGRTSRRFTKNTSNFMQLGTGELSAAFNGLSVISGHVWVNVASFTGSTAFESDILSVKIHENAEAGLVFLFDTSGANNVLKMFTRSVTGEGGQALAGVGNIATRRWSSVGFVMDIGGDSIRVYLNGRLDNVGAVTYSNATWTDSDNQNSTDMMGADLSSPSTTRQLNGRLAELALWPLDITTSGFQKLYDEIDPTEVAPLIRLWRLDDSSSIKSREALLNVTDNGIITGSVPRAAGPPIRPDFRIIGKAPAVVGAENPWYHYAQAS